MGKKRFKAEQIIRMLREADVEVAKGQSVAHVCRKLRISEHTILTLSLARSCPTP